MTRAVQEDDTGPGPSRPTALLLAARITTLAFIKTLQINFILDGKDVMIFTCAFHFTVMTHKAINISINADFL